MKILLFEFEHNRNLLFCAVGVGLCDLGGPVTAEQLGRGLDQSRRFLLCPSSSAGVNPVNSAACPQLPVSVTAQMEDLSATAWD